MKKTYPETWNYSSFYQFHAQKALFKVPKICNINFWIENDPSPLEVFRKFIRFDTLTRPLMLSWHQPHKKSYSALEMSFVLFTIFFLYVFQKGSWQNKILKWNWKWRSIDVHPLSKKELNLTEKRNILEQSASVLRRCIIHGLSDTKQSKAGKCHLVFRFGKISDNRPDPKLVQPLFEIKYHCLPKCIFNGPRLVQHWKETGHWTEHKRSEMKSLMELQQYGWLGAGF